MHYNSCRSQENFKIVHLPCSLLEHRFLIRTNFLVFVVFITICQPLQVSFTLGNLPGIFNRPLYLIHKTILFAFLYLSYPVSFLKTEFINTNSSLRCQSASPLSWCIFLHYLTQGIEYMIPGGAVWFHKCFYLLGHVPKDLPVTSSEIL